MTTLEADSLFFPVFFLEEKRVDIEVEEKERKEKIEESKSPYRFCASTPQTRSCLS